MADTTLKQPGVKHFLGLDWNYGALRQAGPNYWRWVALLTVFVMLAGAAWALILTQGGEVLGMRDNYPWGLWFVDYMYFVGLSAGGLVVYSSVHLFGAKEFAPLSRLAVLQAAVLVMIALLSIVTDMEQPWRTIGFLTSPNFTSPFIYTASAANIYMVLAFADLYVLISGRGGHRLAHTMTLIALPAAVYLHTTTAFVLSLNKSRELWNTAMMVPIFLTSATASGIALLVCFAYAMQKFGGMKFKPSMFESLLKLLAIVIIVDLFFLAIEIITVFWPTSAKPGHAIRLEEFITGRYAWSFLPVFIIGAVVVVLFLKSSTRRVPWIQITASAAYVVAIFLKRFALEAMGFSINTIGQQVPMYFPSLVEIFLAVGLVAFGLLFITFIVKLLPMKVPTEDEHAEETAEDAATADSPATAPATAVAADPALDSGVTSP